MIPAWTAAAPWPDDAREMLLVGPPGTGKTRAVLESYVWPLLRERGRVLATSFTRAAAGELRTRTAAELGGDPEDWRTQLSTIHSEASRRCAALKFDFERRGKTDEHVPGEGGDVGPEGWLSAIESQSERTGMQAWDYVRQVWPTDIGRPPRERLARILSGTRLDEATAEVARDLHARTSDGVLVRPDFTGLLEAALVDGGDRVLDLLAVDEAQDLTPLQWALVDRWAGWATRLLVVGDPDQAIYGWAGADGRRLLAWLRAGRPARRLAQSWRVPSVVHHLAQRVVRQIDDREDSPYQPADREGVLAPDITEAQAAQAAAGAQARGKTALVLARTRRGLGAMISALEEEGVPHFAERLHGAAGRGPDHLSKAFRIARALSAWAWRGPATHADAKAAIGALATGGPALAGARRGTKTALVDGLKRGQPVPLSALADASVDTRALVAAWDAPDEAWWSAAILPRMASVDDVLVVRGWLVDHGGDDAPVIDAADRVRLTTAHGSKGREADLVILDARTRMDMRPRPDDADVRAPAERRDEDLRVLYVAVTRARHELTVIRGERDWLDLHGL